jgi:protoporphyrinogen oxidase
MRVEPVHSIILGAGTSGLAAGHILAKAGQRPVILEKDSFPGGLFRSIHQGNFIVDIGRKELYNRIAKVDAFWSELLGSDYRTYSHRGGILFDRHIIEMSPTFRGFRRGMPWSMLLGCGLDFVWSRVRPGKSAPRNVEEYFYQKRGRQLTRIASQGFQEKLSGKKWGEIPVGDDTSNGEDAHFFSIAYSLASRIISTREVNTYKGIWRHPAKGTGQICDLLADQILKAGGTIHYRAKITEIGSDRGKIDSITAEIDSETVIFKPLNLVSSIPPQLLKRFLNASSSVTPDLRPPTSGGGAPKRTVILVYLFLNEEPHFPHAWLQVTCPSTRIGRITNYAAFSQDMVPEGKTCLCCEMYCFGPDPLLEMDDQSIVKLVLDDCAGSGLLDPKKCSDHLVLRLPGADASQNRDNWMNASRIALLAELEQFRNLYYVNRTETDIATLAGMEAAEAILSGDRSHFDRRIDPAELGIRSESKAFEFKLPVSVEN